MKFIDNPPPTRTGDAGKYTAEQEALRARPGQWAILTEGASSYSLTVNINKGTGSWGPQGSYESRSRKNDGNQLLTVYVRYVGEPADGAA